MTAVDRLRTLANTVTPPETGSPYHGGYRISDDALIAAAPELARWAADAAEYVDIIGAYLSSVSNPSPALAQAEDLLARLDEIVPEPTS